MASLTFISDVHFLLEPRWLDESCELGQRYQGRVPRFFAGFAQRWCMECRGGEARSVEAEKRGVSSFERTFLTATISQFYENASVHSMHIARAKF